ncbi:MAG: hypothetical protein JSS01_03885 [Proteobacteria bacterium]|nr:hypothetical protein [Pseudomonadota bacterium]
MRVSLTLIASSVILTACGGGGSSNDGPGAGSSPSTEATPLTSANYVTVAQKALSSNAYLLDSASLVTGAQVSDPKVLVRFGQDQMSKLPGWLAQQPAQAVGAVQTETEPCDGGGTLTISVNDRNNNQKADAGDSISLSANNCSYAGTRLNGQLNLTINSLSGDPDFYPFSLKATLQYVNLTAQTAQASIVGNGSLAMSLEASASNAQAVALSTPNFSVASTYGGNTATETLKNYESSLKVSAAGRDESWASSANGTLLSSTFGSRSITIETIAPFVRTGSQAYPARGSAVITGAAGAKIRVTALSATSVSIELDADGNGSYETTTTKPWSEVF